MHFIDKPEEQNYTVHLLLGYSIDSFTAVCKINRLNVDVNGIDNFRFRFTSAFEDMVSTLKNSLDMDAYVDIDQTDSQWIW
jgi:hypothetical protein